MPGPGRPTNDPSDYFAWGKQSAKDVEATTFTFPKHLDGSGWEIDDENERVREGGDGQEVGLTYRTLVKADPSVAFLARPNQTARAFAYVNGGETIGSG